MLTAFTLKNFKSFREARLPLGTLTMLVGANASGIKQPDRGAAAVVLDRARAAFAQYPARPVPIRMMQNSIFCYNTKKISILL